MLHTFVSSQGGRFGAAKLGVAAFSIAAHAALITFAAVNSGRVLRIAFVPNPVPDEEILFIHPRDPEHRTVTVRKRALGRAARKAARLIVPDLTSLRTAVDATLASLPKMPAVDLDIAARTSDAHDFADAYTGTLASSGTMWALTHPGRDGAYAADVVEKVAWPEKDNPKPRYPELLRQAGVEGSFVVEFVVDSTGRVDAKTLNFPTTAHPMFLKAVRDALLRSHYFPAELAGVRVRQLVQQQFSFVLVRR
ncbi:MAG TPA: energy transducer TonB [Gemmatimonadaceae bacterium]|jgi:protein TonB